MIWMKSLGEMQDSESDYAPEIGGYKFAVAAMLWSVALARRLGAEEEVTSNRGF